MRAAGLALALMVLVGCAGPARELAGGRAGGAGPRLLVESLAARFGPLEREPAFDALRPKLARAALVPSRIFDEPAAWTTRERDWRSTELVGVPTVDGCRIGVRPAVAEPSRPGEYRERVRLARIGPGRFEWDVSEELAVGRLAHDDLVAATAALLRGAERGDTKLAPEAIRRDLPRASAAFGRLFLLDTLRLDRQNDGTALITLVVRLTPSGLQASAPHYAAYLRKYLTPMSIEAVASDLSGARWWRLSAAENVWTLRLRVRDGSLTSLDGGRGSGIPGELQVVTDYDTRMGVFAVGVRGLVARVSVGHSPSELGVVARFQEDPQWRLPFLVAPLIRGTLRYPFEGSGSEVRFYVRSGAQQHTLLGGRYRTRVRESWLLRWLGGLTTTALDDFRRAAEGEAEHYHRACLLALRDDLAALAGGQ
jgi:hypothetical protein